MTLTAETRTVAVPGATITYHAYPAVTPSAHRPLFLVGSPMDSAGFATLRGHFTDRMVLTYDPRGTGDSPLTVPVGECDPTQHAADLHAVLADAAVGPVDVFASSGGAVNALAWIATLAPDVRVLVAHEPPTSQFVPDREVIEAVVADITDTYRAAGLGPAMAKFIVLVSQQGPLPEDYLTAAAPDPARFGLPTTDDGTRDDPLVGLNMGTCTPYRHDVAALRATRTRVVVASGLASGQEFAARGARALAAAADLEHVAMPGDHSGFLGGEYGQFGEPDAFGAALRALLDD